MLRKASWGDAQRHYLKTTSPRAIEAEQTRRYQRAAVRMCCDPSVADRHQFRRPVELVEQIGMVLARDIGM